MDKIEKIRQEIERRLNILTNVYAEQVERKDEEMMNYYHGKVIALEELRPFLDTLSEEDTLPCWKKVHTYTQELRKGDMEKMLLDLSIGKGKRKTKIALPDRVVDLLSKEPDKSLEEEISRTYHDGSVTDTEDIDHVAYENIAHHFAEWQASRMPMPEDTVLFNKGVAEGRRLEREDMLKDAVEGYVNYYEDSGGILMAEAQVGCPYHNGDKVRIVVLKEEEE